MNVIGEKYLLLRTGCAFLTLLCAVPAAQAWTPGTGNPSAVQGFVVDTTNRTDVLAYYNCVYSASENYAAEMAWSGTVSATVGVAGTTSSIFKDDVRRRINFYRGLVALPADITFDSGHCSDDQDAALMFSRNNSISHTPPPTWLSFTLTGSNAAHNSNIGWGVYGPGAIDAYIVDDGSGNEPVGHRRWLVYSQAQIMGTGDVPTSGTFYCASANWVIGNFKPSPLLQFVPWPNRGFTPLPLVPARWSLTYPGANFSAATVVMTISGTSVSAPIISSTVSNVGDSTIVWTPAGLPSSIAADTTYNVTVSGITGSGVPASFSYSVTLFDPGVLGDSVTITGTSAPPITGANYSFNSIAQADSYNLNVSTGSTAAWVEGAEDSTASMIQAVTTGTYALRQTAVVRTGAKAFQLAFPDFNDQSFELLRDILVTGSSQLQFYDLGRFATTTTTLSAEISTDTGNTWTSVWSRNGVGLSSSLWDPAFNSRSISLAAYAGQIVRVRFILRYNNGSAVVATDSTCGFFIDDITVTNATQLVNQTSTSLSGTTTSFALSATTAGSSLTAGSTYYMRIQPNVGTRWFSFGAMKTVTALPLVSYSNWVTSNYPQVTGGPGADYDRDGIPNGIEFAFGLNPTLHNPPSTLPQPIPAGNALTFTYTEPVGITGVTYGAQWSTDLMSWHSITDTGSGSTHIFSVSTLGVPRLFLRHYIIITP